MPILHVHPEVVLIVFYGAIVIPSLNPHKHPMEVYYNKNVTETLAQRVVRLSI